MGRRDVFKIITFLICTFCFHVGTSQKSKDVYVDTKGVMRWGDNDQEVFGFGINYTAPFAHAYRSAKKLNVDLEKEIEQDVYHFARLGFDAFRVHVWDTEISDTLGNLLENDHLRLFDFMLAKMKERGMKMLITPIAFWNNGYPEKDDPTPGFATRYGKDACLINPNAIRAQEQYLFQFLNHVNQYTGIAYKDDPAIVAFEISNEPHHRGQPEEVKEYINRMEKSMRKTGCKKPVFYNVSHSVHHGSTYFDSNINGGTFQWYPTGLGAAHELRGNFLPNVDRYTFPFDDVPAFKSKAKVVYEFDAADVGRSYIYPAIARTFREAGIQWATHFAYDPSFLSYANTEYNTHYMNLLYAPQKALSLKIAGEVFHHIPRYKTFGRYPANTSFDGFRVSYEEDLAEFSNENKFFYTNSTSTVPKNIRTLTEISGYGSSAVVTYQGRGAYFLDKISDGIWRLEVYPDAIWVDNVFGKNSLDREVAVLEWNELPMKVVLPDLGTDFAIAGVLNQQHGFAEAGSFKVRPGVYILKRKSLNVKIDLSKKIRNISVNEFGAKEMPLSKSYVVHQPFEQVSEGIELTLTADVVSPNEPKVVSLQIGSGWGVSAIEMKKTSPYRFEATIPADKIKAGILSYHICIQDGNAKWTTYPSRSEKIPSDWDFDGKGFTTMIVPKNSPLYLFTASNDADEVSKEWRAGSGVIPFASGSSGLLINIPKLYVPDEENVNGKPVFDYSLRYNFVPNMMGRATELSIFKKLIVEVRTMDADFPLQVALIDKAGYAYGALIQVKRDIGTYEVDLASFKPVKHVTLPRPYPTFLPYFFEPQSPGIFNISHMETLQVSVGPGIEIPENGNGQGYKFILESVRLE
jgi:hypothetical protein